MLDICLLGCGGMMPLPYQLADCADDADTMGSSLLIDCGEGTQDQQMKGEGLEL